MARSRQTGTAAPARLMYMYIYTQRRRELARTIAISDEVYELLKKSKLPSESFSSVIRRNLRKGKLAEISGSGTISKADWKRVKKHLLAAEGRTVRELAESL